MTLKDTNLPLIGGILAAIGASICCAGPLILLLLGISGTWISSLTLFEPYRPLLIAIMVLLFGYTGWKIYRPIAVCEPGTACAIPHIRRRRQRIFWISALLALGLITSNYWLPVLID